jgi:release factor glutamine methyltransferase
MKPNDWLPPESMTTTNDLGAWLNLARQRLNPVSSQPGLESLLLAAHALGRGRIWVEAHPETNLAPETIQYLNEILERLANGEPLAYITGYQEFFGLDFIVSQDVLIPRPETELLVETAIAWLQEHPLARNVIDVGTGSGCIPIALATQIKTIDVTAVDISRPAIRVARQNCRNLETENRVRLVQTDLMEPFTGQFDLICANLPYIPEWKLPDLQVTRYEPLLALNGGIDGLILIARLLGQLPDRLAQGGMALFEIEAGQGQSALALAKSITGFEDVHVQNDLAGLPRLLIVRKPNG